MNLQVTECARCPMRQDNDYDRPSCEHPKGQFGFEVNNTPGFIPENCPLHTEPITIYSEVIITKNDT